LPTFIETPWIPVERIKASDDEIDALVEEAEHEFGDNTTTKTNTSTRGRKGQKMNQARKLFKSIKHLPRNEIVSKFMSELGLSSGTANTYYYVIKKKIKE